MPLSAIPEDIEGSWLYIYPEFALFWYSTSTVNHFIIQFL